MSKHKLNMGDRVAYAQFNLGAPESRSMDAEWLESAALRHLQSTLLQAPVSDASLKGLVMDEKTIEVEQLDSSTSADYLEKVLAFRATVIYRLPRRGELLHRVMDIFAYRSGSSFRTSTGKIIVNSAGVLENLDHPMQFIPEWLDEKELPFRPLWEPDYEMSPQAICYADFDVTGMPARARVQRDDRIIKPLLDGAL